MFFPQLAQRSVDGSDLIIQGMNITAPSPEGFTLDLRSRIENTGPISATLDPMTLSLTTLDGKVLGNITTPELHARSSGEDLTVSQRFTITNTAGFFQFGVGLLLNQTAQFRVSGQTTLRALGQHTTVQYNKTIAIPGTHPLSG